MERKLSIEQMVWRIGFSGKLYLMEVESGRAVPSLSMLSKIAQVLEVDLIDLVSSPEQSPRERLIAVTRLLSQGAIHRLVEQAERFHEEEKPSS